MLEKYRLNNEKYKFREEKNDKLLAFNVVNANIIFFTGKTKKFIMSLINNDLNNNDIEDIYLNFLLENEIILKN